MKALISPTKTNAVCIKPISDPADLTIYFFHRYRVYNDQYSDIRDRLESVQSMEVEKLDMKAFHFGAYDYENNLLACTRMAQDYRLPYFQPMPEDDVVHGFIETLLNGKRETSKVNHSLGLMNFANNKDAILELENYLEELRGEGKKFNEIGRLINVCDQPDRQLMVYMICYAWAFNLYQGIDYCFFEASETHCRFYERMFNCERVAMDLQLDTVFGPMYLMKATMSAPSAMMEAQIVKMVESFNITE